MSIATYTQQIIDELNRTGEARLPYSNVVEMRRMRSRLANAARRSGLIITTTIDRGGNPACTPTGHVVGTVMGWRP